MTGAAHVAETSGGAPKLTMRDRHRILTREHIMAAALEADELAPVVEEAPGENAPERRQRGLPEA